MLNENVDESPEEEEEEEVFSEEQKSRISQKFRAAKALLARKRPRDTSSFALHVSSPKVIVADGSSPLSGGSIIKRLPLVELSVNTPGARTVKGLQLRNAEDSASPCSRKPVLTSIDLGEGVRNVSRTLEDVAELDSFRTPAKPVEHELSDAFLTPSVLDDDFDDSILEEIDVLCEQKVSAQQESDSHGEGDVESLPRDSSSTEFNPEPAQITESIQRENRTNNENPLGSSMSGEQSASKMLKGGSMPYQYSKYLESLNERQQEAACNDISIPLMIVAGPGSGKTSTMVGRILVLLNEGLDPSNILAMTFTTAAASEMRDRIGAIAGKEVAKGLTVSTFHSFSLQLCRSHADKLGRTPEFSIFGQGQQRRVVIEAMRLLENANNKCNLDVSELVDDPGSVNSPNYLKDKSKKWQKFVTQAKASGKTPQYFTKLGNENGAAVLELYDNVLRSCNALDYHDLISCSVKLLTDYPEVLRECQETWKAIIIDEFQDTSAMQYSLLKILASHNHITIVGDDDQSIFSFNGADISGFNSFRKDFPNHKEIRLNKNYRSTRCIVEAASSLIRNNVKRCQFKDVLTDNSSGSKVTIKECYNEEAQCSFVVDKILEAVSNSSAAKCSYGDIAILYRRQVSGKIFQVAFRDRKIPFNIHGVAFYRKKVVRAIFAMLKTTLPGCDDGPYRQVFKALLPSVKEEKKRVIDHIEKVSAVRNCSFISAASDIFSAKISGTFKRSQLTQGRKVLSTLEMIKKLVHREQSISTVITSVANMIPQKYLLEQRAVVNNDGGKLLNEDDDIRSVLQYLLDDVSNFLSTQFVADQGDRNDDAEGKGCFNVLKAFIDFISDRERENFHSRRHDNENSVNLTTMHQSKGLEWDVVFIVKTNESEIPLLHEFNGAAKENGSSLEEERRLFYVAMTRARKKLYILYVMMDGGWQMLQPSRFLKEIPSHLLDIQAELSKADVQPKTPQIPKETVHVPCEKQCPEVEMMPNELQGVLNDITTDDSARAVESCGGNCFLKRFSVDDRSVVSHLFHQWAKRPAFKDPKRLLDKVGFVIDERLRVKKNKNKDVLCALKTCLNSDDALQYAEYVLRWEQLPADQRAHLSRERQEHFQKLKIEKSMGSSAPTSKQISYLQNLGCTVTPTSRLHASRLIEQYKSL